MQKMVIMCSFLILLAGCGEKSSTPPDAARPTETTDSNTTSAPVAETKFGFASEAAFTVPELGLKMVWIKPGTFMMGSPKKEKSRDLNETRHRVTLTKGYLNETRHRVTLTKGYWMGKYEVTQAQYKAVTGKNPSEFAGANRPVETVSWGDAVAFCRKLTERERRAGRLPGNGEYRLPTEAEWEYACRAGTVGKYAGELDAMAWHGGNSSQQTHEVGRKRPNAWGLYDMHGNVWEWCADWYGDYPTGAVTDPTGSERGSYRVYRGGSWDGAARGCRSAYRYGPSPGLRWFILGFRLLRTVP
jgi:formylglycine-generating enzyme required for sulfatase activity